MKSERAWAAGRHLTDGRRFSFILLSLLYLWGQRFPKGFGILSEGGNKPGDVAVVGARSLRYGLLGRRPNVCLQGNTEVTGEQEAGTGEILNCETRKMLQPVGHLRTIKPSFSHLL